MPPLSAFLMMILSYDFNDFRALASPPVMFWSIVIFSGAILYICSIICLSSLFLVVTGSMLFSFTRASFLKLQSKYFSRILSFLVNAEISAFASWNVPLVDGQKVVPFKSREI